MLSRDEKCVNPGTIFSVVDVGKIKTGYEGKLNVSDHIGGISV